jgi:UDP-2-acetamido-3-amino-2,3-dideoxy-glucuronate N-acetyltransferase
MTSVRVHPTAIVEDDVEIGEGTSVWDNAHLRGPSKIGSNCIIGGKSYIAYDVVIGDLVKINSFVYICAGVIIEDGVMLSAGVTFTNDLLPRATDPDVRHLRPSEPDDDMGSTTVRRGATIGARAVIGPDLDIGEFAMVGMGAIVTHDVPAHHLSVGGPSRSVGLVCSCGAVFARGVPAELGDATHACPRCNRTWHVGAGVVTSADG